MKLSHISAAFSQEADSCDDNELCQTLAVKIEDAGAGPYFVIETSRWAIDPEGLPELVKRLQSLLDQVQP